MPRTGSGTYVLPAGNPVVPSTTIQSSWANNTLNDIASALSQSLSKDGQTTPTANLPMGGLRHTAVGDAMSVDNYATAGQAQNQELIRLTTQVTSTGTAYQATLPLATDSSDFDIGSVLIFIPTPTNTGGATTLSINAESPPVDLLTFEGTVPPAGFFVDGMPYYLRRVVTGWQAESMSVAGEFVAKTGDTMSGDLTIQTASGNPELTLIPPAGAVSVQGQIGVGAAARSPGGIATMLDLQAQNGAQQARMAIQTGASPAWSYQVDLVFTNVSFSQGRVDSAGNFDNTIGGGMSWRMANAAAGGMTNVMELTNDGNLSVDGSVTAPLGVSALGPSARIVGDFSNTTLSQRTAFQGSGVNLASDVPILPNGTSTVSAISVFNNSDPTNAGYGSFQGRTTDVRIAANISGAGAYVPITFYTNGAEKMRLDTSGRLGIGVVPSIGILETFHTLAGNPATSGTADPAVSTRLRSSNVAIDFGVLSAGQAWIQPRLYTDLASNFGLLLCPNGANVNVGYTTNQTEKFSVNGTARVAGFSTLGDGGPSIKMKKLTGTTAASQGANASVAHGLSRGKILSAQVIINDGASSSYTPNSIYAGGQFAVSLDDTNLNVFNASGASSNILSKAFTALITYES